MSHQLFDSSLNEWIPSSLPSHPQPEEEQKSHHYHSSPEFCSVGILNFRREGPFADGPRSQRLPARLYKKLKGTMMLLMGDIRQQLSEILFWKDVSPPVVDALRSERIIQETYEIMEWKDAGGPGLSTILMWNARYTVTGISELEESSGVLPLDATMKAQIVFLRGVVKEAQELAVLSVQVHSNMSPASTVNSVTTSEDSTESRTEQLALWKAFHSLSSNVMNRAKNVMIISNITEAAPSVTFEDPEVPPGLSGPESLKLRGIAEAKAATTLFTMGPRLAPARLSPFVSTKLHSRSSAGGVDLILSAKVFTVGLSPAPQQQQQGGHKVSGIQPPQAIGVGQRAKLMSPSSAPASSESQQLEPVDLPTIRWSLDRTVSLQSDVMRSCQQLFDLTPLTPSVESLVTALNKGETSDKPQAIGMNVSLVVDPQLQHATEIQWPFPYAIYNQTLLVDDQGNTNATSFQRYAEENKKIADTSKRLWKLFERSQQQKRRVSSSLITPVTSSEFTDVNPSYCYSAAQPPMDALRATQQEVQQGTKQRQCPSSPSNIEVALFFRRRRQWNINHAILLFQMSPIEAQLDISSQIGVMRNALASAVSRLNGHAEPQENAVPALRAAIQAERSKALPGVSSPAPMESSDDGGVSDRLSISSQRRSSLLDVINFGAESAVVDPLVSFPYDYALVYSQELEAYWMLAATDVPCDVAVCQAYVRGLEETTRV